MKCKYCGRELREGATFCDGCGGQVVAETVTEPVINNQTPNKGSSKTIIIVIAVLALILIAVGIFLLSGNGGSSNNGTNTNNTNTSTDNGNTNTNTTPTPTPSKPNEDLEDYLTEEQAQEIINKLEDTIECYEYDFRVECLIRVKNNSNRAANVVMREISFYDKEGNQVGYAKGPRYSNGLGPGKEGLIYAYDVINYHGETQFTYDSYKVSYYLQEWFVTRDHRDDVTVTELESNDNEFIVFKVKNNSEETIDSFDVYALYYKNGDIINVKSGAGYDLYKTIEFDKYERLDGIAPGEEVYARVKHPTRYQSDERKIIDYDRYELVIHDAYTIVKSKR